MTQAVYSNVDRRDIVTIPNVYGATEGSIVVFALEVKQK